MTVSAPDERALIAFEYVGCVTDFMGSVSRRIAGSTARQLLNSSGKSYPMMCPRSPITPHFPPPFENVYTETPPMLVRLALPLLNISAIFSAALFFSAKTTVVMYMMGKIVQVNSFVHILFTLASFQSS